MRKPYNQVLLEERISRGHSVRTMARLIGVSASYVSRIERGLEPRPPSDDVIVRWCKALRIEHDDIFWRCGQLPPIDKRRLKRFPKRVSMFLRCIVKTATHNRAFKKGMKKF